VQILLWPDTPAVAPASGMSPVRCRGPIFLETLRTRGVSFEESEPTPYPFGLRLTALDPDGNRVAFRQARPAPSRLVTIAVIDLDDIEPPWVWWRRALKRHISDAVYQRLITDTRH
jgi:hypothetical protein